MGAFVKVLYVVVGVELGFFVFLALLDQQRDQVGLDGNGADQVDVDVPDELFEHGAVASDAATCSEIGRDILERGFSAVDAAVASCFCLGLFSRHSSGLGGGGLLLIYKNETRTSEVIDSRETFPSASQKDEVARNRRQLATKGGETVLVPGVLRGFEMAWKKYGKLPWKDLFQPAIELATKGFKVHPALAAAIEKNDMNITDCKSLREIVDDDNNVLTESDVIKRPQLAATLRAVADGGADAFYTGEIAKNLVKEIQYAGGSMTEEDLANYRVKVTRPLNISLPGGLFLLTSPAPSGGPILSLTLNILEGYALNASAIDDDDNKALTYHRMIEAFKVASDQGNLLGDQTFLNSDQITARMTSKPFAASLRREMDTSRATRSAKHGSVFATTDHRGTHVSVLGPNNDAVSITTGTSSTGRQCLSTSTGIILNSHTSPRKQRARRGRPNPANIGRPGERPKTAMSPTIIVDSHGDVKLVIGASGGQQLIPTLAETIVRYLWLGMNLTSAIEKPRLLPADDGISFKYEKDRPFKPEAVLNQLEREYGRAAPEENQATVQAVARENSAIFAHSDSRNGGFPAGF